MDEHSKQWPHGISIYDTLFVCVSIVISKALVSCVIGLKEKLQPSMTSTIISMFFFTKNILCHRTNSLSMKHTNALELSDVLVSIIMDLLYLIMINNKKQGVRFKGKLDHFEHMMRPNLVSRSLLKLDILVSRVFKRWHVNGNG
jgi:hypothetical protein